MAPRKVTNNSFTSLKFAEHVCRCPMAPLIGFLRLSPCPVVGRQEPPRQQRGQEKWPTTGRRAAGWLTGCIHWMGSNPTAPQALAMTWPHLRLRSQDLPARYMPPNNPWNSSEEFSRSSKKCDNNLFYFCTWPRKRRNVLWPVPPNDYAHLHPAPSWFPPLCSLIAASPRRRDDFRLPLPRSTSAGCQSVSSDPQPAAARWRHPFPASAWARLETMPSQHLNQWI